MPNKCECGCGSNVAKRFVRGHWWKLPSFRKKQAEVMNRLWSSPKKAAEIRSKQSTFCKSPEGRKQRSEHFKNLWKTESYRKAISENTRKSWKKDRSIRIANISAAWTPKKRAEWGKHQSAMMKSVRAKVSKTMRSKFASGELTPTCGTAKEYKQGWLETNKGGKIFYRSSWEQALLEILDSSLVVKSVKAQPFGISYKFGGKRRTYFPDFLVTLKDGRVFLVEVKGRRDIDTGKEKAKIKAGKLYCQSKGIEFVLLAEKPIRPLTEYLQ